MNDIFVYAVKFEQELYFCTKFQKWQGNLTILRKKRM